MDVNMLRFAVGVMAAIVLAVSVSFVLYWQFLGKGHQALKLRKATKQP